MSDISIQVKDVGACFEVKIEGNVELLSVKELKESLTNLAEMYNKNIELDMAEVDYIDSSGLGVLLGVQKTLRKKGKKIIIRKISDKVLSVLRLSSVASLFDL